MKKLLALLVLNLALLAAPALAADADTETPLWPACDPETGLWGYIRSDGTWGIAAQYEYALDFVNGYAEVGMNDHYTASGIIDEAGRYIFQPEYYVERGEMGYDTWVYNDMYILERDGLWGWFDTESGYISGLCWTYVASYDDSPYVIASVGDMATFVNRATGERLLPLMDMFTYGFHEGVAVTWLEQERKTVLIGLEGSIRHLPEGIGAADWYVSDGLLLVKDGNQRYGYVDVHGNVVIEPQYTSAWNFSHGYGAVEKDGERLLIDRENRIIATGWDFVCGPWADGGIAVEGEGCWAVLNPDGTERFRITVKPYDYAKGVMTYPPLVEGGPWWVGYWYGGVGISFGLMTAEGEWLHNADIPGQYFVIAEERFSDDPMGWHAGGYDGKWGYFDGAGNMLLPSIYEDAEHFSGALARVMLDESTEAYINRSGEVVYQWPTARDAR